jgi:hypothetical protein
MKNQKTKEIRDRCGVMPYLGYEVHGCVMVNARYTFPPGIAIFLMKEDKTDSRFLRIL